jgi:nitroreductase
MSNIPLSPDHLLTQLRWRYATKQFDPTRKIPPATWQALQEALRLSPSSYGLQPWKFLIITDAATKQKLVPVSWNQPQLADCSHVVVFAIRKHLHRDHVERFIARLAEVRGVPASALENYRQMIVRDIIDGPRSLIVNEWSARQCYIALGNFMTCAALLGVDTCPLEGIEPARYDEILGLPARGLATVVACAAGYRAATDPYAALPKVRFRPEDIFEHI